MKSDQSRPLGDFVSLQRGNTYKSRLLGQDGPVLLGLATIEKHGGFRSDNLKYYSGESSAKIILYGGDLYVSLKDVTQSAALLGAVARVPDGITGRLTQDTVKLVFENNDSDLQSFIYWLLRTPEYRGYCKAHGTGTTNLGLPREDFLAFTVPPLDENRSKLVETLELIEGKIANNRALAADLEAMARTIFKSWFVDFDPVKAKMEGRAPAGMDADTAALFPDELVESDLGLIPKGWEVAAIADLCEIVGGATPSTKNPEYWDEGRHFWATPKDLSALSAPVLWSTSRQITDKGLAKISSGLLPEGTVLLSSRAPIGYLAINQVPTAINQGFIAMKPVNGASSAFLMLWAKTFMDLIVGNANGSTFQEISKKSFRPIQLVRPPVNVLGAFGSVASPLFDAIANLDAESARLADLRDTLLPRLISGKLSVVEGATIRANGLAEN